jgi:ribosomal protein S18 acetylase RimI-like enzyme
VKSIVVSENLKGKGVGTALMKYAENYFGKSSKHMFLCVSSFNKAAQSFYKRLGYEQAGEFKDYIIEGESEILMHKKLA